MFLDEKVRMERRKALKIVLFFSLLAAVTVLSAKADTGAQRYRVFSFRNIPAEKAVDFLKQANLAVDCQIVQNNIISITAGQQELAKASEVLRLVDSAKPFEIKIIPSAASSVPPAKKISSALGNIQIGSLTSPPVGQGDRAIIEVSENSCLIIAPQDRIGQIEQFLKPNLQTVTDQNTTADKNAGRVEAADKETAAVKQKTKTPDFLDATSLLEIKTQETGLKTQETGLKTQETADANLSSVRAADTTPITDVLGKLADSLSKPGVASTKIDIGELQKFLTDANSSATRPADKTASVVPTGKEPAKAPLGTTQPSPKVEPAAKTSTTIAASAVVDVNQVITVSLPEKIPIIQLIGLISEYFHLNYVYDPAKVQGDINVRLENKLEGKITIGQLYGLLESTLKSKNLVMTRRDNFVFIVPKEEVTAVDPALVDSRAEILPRGNIVIARIFKLKFIDAESIRNLLTGLGLGIDINTQASSAGYIIITEYAYRMGRVEDLINMVDKPGSPKQIRFRQLKFTMATTLRDKIKTLADQLGTVSITVARGAAPQQGRGIQLRPGMPPAPPPTPAPAPAPSVEAKSVYIDVDDRTNRLLMIGYDEQINIVNGLINTLDVEQQDLRSLRLYEIQYADAQDVVTKLEQLGIITAGRARTTTPTRTTIPGRMITQPTLPIQPPGPAGAASQAAAQASIGELLSEEPQIIVIESTNSLLVNATKEQHFQITTIIGYVDNEPKQASTNYVVYPLESQDPEEMATVLNKLIQETVENRDPTGKVVSTSVTRKTEEDIIIIPDKNTFSIICYASKKNQQWVESLIKQLDKRRPQVLIDVTLVEISKNDDFTLALDLVTKYPSIPLVGNLAKIALIDPNEKTGRRVWGARSTSGAGGTAFYADRDIQALLTAVSNKGYGRVIGET